MKMLKGKDRYGKPISWTRNCQASAKAEGWQIASGRIKRTLDGPFTTDQEALSFVIVQSRAYDSPFHESALCLLGRDVEDCWANATAGFVALVKHAEHKSSPQCISDLIADLLHLVSLRGQDPLQTVAEASMRFRTKESAK
jgi:hypothetical protein